MNRSFRLTNSTEFMRVRRFGKSYAHPLVLLLVLPAPDECTRIGVTAGRSLGKAVQRNHAKRMLRESVRSFLPIIKPGWMMVLVSRNPILQAGLPEIHSALEQLLTKANLLRDDKVS